MACFGAKEWKVEGDAGLSPQQCLGGNVTAGPKGYRMKQKIMTLKEKCDISDQDGNVDFRVGGKMLSLRGRMTIYDADGKKVALLSQKLWNGPLSLIVNKANYQIFTFEPNFEGQVATDKENGEPLYRWAQIEQDWMRRFFFQDRYTYYLYPQSLDKNAPRVPILDGESGFFACRFSMGIKKHGTDQVVGAVGKNTTWWKGDHAVEVASGSDALATICFAEAVRHLKREDRG